MSDRSQLAEADAQLRAAYGSTEVSGSASSWSLFLQVLLVGLEGSEETAKSALRSAAFVTPASLFQMSAGQLVEQLAGIPRGPQKSSLLRSVAEWWIGQFGDEVSPAWSRGLEYYRESLRQIRGLGPATVDGLLMFVARLPVFPLDRGTIRIAVRHGWLDLPLEDETAQSFFVRGLQGSDIDPISFFQLMSRVAVTHCGREPKCDGCPLQTLLPPNGPLNPDGA